MYFRVVHCTSCHKGPKILAEYLYCVLLVFVPSTMSTNSGSDYMDCMDSESDLDSCMDSVQRIKDLISQANRNNIILTTISACGDILEDLSCVESEDEDEDANGPKCHLCNDAAFSDEQRFRYNGSVYTLVFKCAESSMVPNFGFLQCASCSNFFHRNKCSLSMSDAQYYKFKCNRVWRCPNCVPIFKMRIHKNVLFSKHDNITFTLCV